MESKSPKTHNVKSPVDIKFDVDTSEETTFGPTMEESVVKDVPKVKEPPKDVWPKMYVCRVKCWVASKVKTYEVGDIVGFHEGEYVPTHFEEI